MATVQLSATFTPIPEGRHIFKIVDVAYDPEFGSMHVKMVTSKGKKHTERFKLMDQNEKPNEGAISAFSFFARTALNDFARESIDHGDLTGHYIEAEVLHNKVPSTKKEGEFVTFIRLGEKHPASGFEVMGEAEEAPAAPAATAAKSSLDDDLDGLLGL